MAIVSRKEAVSDWVKSCMAQLEAELKAKPGLKLEETEVFKSNESLIVAVPGLYVHKDDPAGLFSAAGNLMWNYTVIVELISNKYKDYSFLNDFSALWGIENVFNLGLWVAENMEKNPAFNGLVPKKDITKLVKFFSKKGKSQGLPETPATFDLFKGQFIMQALHTLNNLEEVGPQVKGGQNEQ